MQTEYALLIPEEDAAKIGNTVIKGQILVPVVAIRSITAPTAKRHAFKVSLDVFIGMDDAPSKNDCNWLMPGGPGCKLRDIQVVLAFLPGTLTATAVQPTGGAL